VSLKRLTRCSHLIFQRIAKLFQSQVNRPPVRKFAECFDVARADYKLNWSIQDMSNPQILAAQKEFIERIYSTKPFGISTDRTPGNESYDFQKVNLGFLHLVAVYCVTRASTITGTKHLRILDFGGGVGNHLHIFNSLLPWLSIEYQLVELEQNLKFAQELNPQIARFSNLSQVSTTDFVHLGSSLQYCASWQEVLFAIISKEPKSILLTRTPMTKSITRLWKDSNGYMEWAFSKDDLIYFFSKHGFTLIRNFDITDATTYKSNNGFKTLVTEEQLLFEYNKKSFTL